VPTCKTFSATQNNKKAKREEGPTSSSTWMDDCYMAVMKRPFKHQLNIFMEDNWLFTRGGLVGEGGRANSKVPTQVML
jgi:hypothetical protein